jgi:dTDP-glucose 4,6-dehydratase
MRLLVSGGCGFVGSNFVRFVLQHYGPEMITVVDSLASGTLPSVRGLADEYGERYEFLRADAGDAARIDTVLSTHQYFGVVNFTGASARAAEVLLERARVHGARRFLQASHDRLVPKAPAEKLSLSDALALEAWSKFEQEVVITRAACNYGPFQSPAEFIPATIIRALRDEPVPVPGDGAQARAWLHVEDHCSAIFAALLAGAPGSIFPLVGDECITDLEVAHAILDHLGKPRARVRLGAPAADAGAGVSDEQHLASRQLDWKPRRHFAAALRETVDWYVHRREWWEALPACPAPSRS